MKLLTFILGLALSLACNGQGTNVFFSSHSAGCRPAGLTTYTFYDSLSVDGGAWYKGATLAEAKDGRMEYYNTYVITASFHGKSFDAASLVVGQVTFQNYPAGSCYGIHDGWWYYTDGSQPYPIYEISGGSIASINTTTSATGEGYLYNWYAVNGDTDGDGDSDEDLAPDGWRVPDSTDFATLVTYLTDNGFGYGGSGNDVAFSIAATTGWTSYGGYGGAPGYDQATNNSTGFNLISYGFRDYVGTYQGGLIGASAIFWKSYAYSSLFGATVSISYNIQTIPTSASATYKKAGYNVRLIKTTSNNRNYLIDYDGNHYATVQIGNQTWLASNYKCTHYRDGTAIPHVIGNTAWGALTTGAYCIYGEPTE